MKLLFVYPPFCTPTVPPYSLAYLSSFIEDNLGITVKCLDLNAKFHKSEYSKFYSKMIKMKDASVEEYGALFEQFNKESMPFYKKVHYEIVNGTKPPLFDNLLAMIKKEKSDAVAFSLVYNSQDFYALELMKALKEEGIPCFSGGPAINSKVGKYSTALNNEVELLEELSKKFKIAKKEFNCNTIPNFSDFPRSDYLSRDRIIPLRSSRGCYYHSCAFCTHSLGQNYYEIDSDLVVQAIKKNKAKNVFFIDDMISSERLNKLSDVLSPLKVKWWCQLRPTRELLGSFKKLSKSGLKTIAFGVESGSQRVLDKMRKGTIVKDVEAVLKESKEAGITNIVFIMFGFPTETKEEFIETYDFLSRNSSNIDLISSSIFGLQKGSVVYTCPEEFDIYEMNASSRNFLDESLSYKVRTGMQREEARELKKKYQKRLNAMQKLPKIFNYLKEQTLLI